MQAKQNSSDRSSAEEASSRKIRTTSNMYMFKVRAFEDVLKSRGAVLPLGQSRLFNYNTKPIPFGDEPIQTHSRSCAVQIDQTSEQIQILMDQVQNLQARYSEAKQLCSDQLIALEESKALMEKEAARTINLEKTLQELKVLVDQQKSVLNQQKIIINKQRPTIEESQPKIQNTKGSDDQNIKVVEELREQLRVVTLKCQIRQRNIDSLKEELQQLRQFLEETQQKNISMQNIQAELQKTTRQYHKEVSHREQLQQQIRDMKLVAEEFSRDIYTLRETIDQYQIELAKITEQDLSEHPLNEQIRNLNEENLDLKRSNQNYSTSLQELRSFLEDIRISHRDFVRSISQKHQQEVKSLQYLLEQETGERKRLLGLENSYLKEIDQIQKNFKMQVEASKIEEAIQKESLSREIKTLTSQLEGFKSDAQQLKKVQKIQFEKKLQQIEASNSKKLGKCQDKIETLLQEKDLLSKELQVVKSVTQKQRKILSARDLTTKQLQIQVDRLLVELRFEQSRASQLQAIVSNSRSTILNNLESAKSTSIRQKQLFTSILEENKQLKAQLNDIEQTKTITNTKQV